MQQVQRCWKALAGVWLGFEQRMIDNLITRQNQRMMTAAQLLDISESEIFDRAWQAHNHDPAQRGVAQEAYRRYLRTDQCPPWVDLYLDRFFDEFERRHLRA